MNTKINVYHFLLEKLLDDLSCMKLKNQIDFLKNRNLSLLVLDFCGKIKKYFSCFKELTSEIYIVDSGFENDILDIIGSYHLVYVLDDISFYKSNILFEYKIRSIFILFDGYKLVKIIKNA